MKKFRIPLFLTVFVLIGGMVSSAAENYDIKEMTPEVTRALEGRKTRFRELQNLKAQGILGEDNQGNVKVLQSAPNAESIASAENANRKVIYQTIVEQNQLGPAGITQVRAAFAETQRERARPGDSIQDASGQWVKK